ncbi:hypothetical protein, partial [Acidithiobacillus thiooxidans]
CLSVRVRKQRPRYSTGTNMGSGNYNMVWGAMGCIKSWRSSHKLSGKTLEALGGVEGAAYAASGHASYTKPMAENSL